MKRMLAILALMLLCASSALAYDKDIHYNMTYYLARSTGFDQAQAHIIASTAQYVDEHGKTWPGWESVTGMGREMLRLYHFPMWDSWTSPLTERNSPHGRYNLTKAIQAASDKDEATHLNSLYKFGESVHVLADSFAHEGYGYVYGHLLDGHNPDKPYYHVERTLETGALLYSRMIEFYRAYYGHDPGAAAVSDWSKMREFLEPIVKREYYYYLNYDHQVEDRCAYWQAQIKNAGLGDAHYDGNQYATDHNTDFEKAIAWHCLPHRYLGAGYTLEPPQVKPGPRVGIADQTVPTLGEYCTVPAVSSGDPVIIVDYLVNKAPYLILAECVRQHVATPAGLSRLMERLAKGAPIYTVMDLMGRSGASAQLKRNAVKPYLASKNIAIRMVAANIFYQLDPKSTEALAVFQDAFRLIKKNGPHAVSIELFPQTDDSFNYLQYYLTKGYSEHKPIAAGGLYNIGNARSLTALQKYASTHKLDGSGPPGLAYWLIMGYEKSGLLSDKVNKAGRQRLIQLAQGSLSKPDLLKPAVTALRTHYNHDKEVARAIIDALDVSDMNVRWHVGYALVVISRQNFDLTDTGLKDIKSKAEDWYEREFPS